MSLNEYPRSKCRYVKRFSLAPTPLPDVEGQDVEPVSYPRPLGEGRSQSGVRA